ncbi:MAG: hypothetical protein HQ579_06085 [Candidatus Omnitrophica bacterium]|nr:hypothetical protein [Candidatus Omnitrophota bacterium]
MRDPEKVEEVKLEFEKLWKKLEALGYDNVCLLAAQVDGGDVGGGMFAMNNSKYINGDKRVVYALVAQEYLNMKENMKTQFSISGFTSVTRDQV